MGALEQRGAQSCVTPVALVMEFGFCVWFCVGGAYVEGKFVWLLWFMTLCHAGCPCGKGFQALA